MPQKRNIKKRIINLLKIIISLGILFYVIFKIDLDALFEVFKKLDFIWLFLALLMFIISKFFSAFRLNRLLKCIHIHIQDKLNIKLYMLGMFYNLFLPGGIGGDAYKIYLLNKNFNIKTKNIFWGIALDRIFGLAALYFLAGIVVLFTDLPALWKFLLAISVPTGIVVFYFFIRYLFNQFSPFFTGAMLYSFAVQLAQLLCAWFLLKAVQQASQNTDYLFVFLASSIVAAIPFTIGGMGSRELTFFYGAQWLGLDISSSIAISLLFYLITALVSLSGIYYSIHTNKITSLFNTTENKQRIQECLNT